jgi:hypothetical protein
VEAMCSSLASNSAHSKKRGETSGEMRSWERIPGDHWSPVGTPFRFTVVAAMVQREVWAGEPIPMETGLGDGPGPGGCSVYF